MTEDDGPGRAGLRVDVGVRLGALDLDVRFDVGPGEVVGLLGPNGAGKSTLLRVLAGIQRPDRGRIALDGSVLTDVDAGVHCSPSERWVGMVFQDELLFPHLRIVDNIAFGLRARGVSREVANQRAREWLERVHAGSLAGRRPDHLSGGEAQRVSLARALAIEPAILLLDEPLSSLDAQARLDIRRELAGVLAAFGGPTLMVTHDPAEAVGLAHRLVILDAGQVTQQGTPDEVGRHPRSAWVARLLGLNFLQGRANGRAVELEGGFVLETAEDCDGTVAGVFDPSDVRIAPARKGAGLAGSSEGAARGSSGRPRSPGGSIAEPNVWIAPLAGVESFGRRLRVHLGGPLPMIVETKLDQAKLESLSGQDALRVHLPPRCVRVYPA